MSLPPIPMHQKRTRTKLVQYPDLKVALLMNEIVEVKKLSDAFKNFGVRPYFYDHFNELERHLNQDQPHLLIIDIDLIKDDSLEILNHRAISSKEVEVVFFYRKSSWSFLKSFYDYEPLGELREDAAYKSQLAKILALYTRLSLPKDERYELTQKYQKLAQELKRTQENFSRREVFYSSFSFEKSFLNCIHQQVLKFGFREGLIQALEQQSWLSDFAFLELNSSGHRLESIKNLKPEAPSSKLVSLESIFLPQNHSEGINQDVIELAQSSFSSEVLGKTMSLSIYSKPSQPQMLLICNLKDPKLFYQFDQSFIESFLSGLLGQEKNAQRYDEELSFKFHISPWEMFEKIENLSRDTFYQNNSEQNKLSLKSFESSSSHLELELIDLNFERLMSSFQKDSSLVFCWEQFYRKFMSSLREHLGFDFQYSCFGLHHFGLMIPKSSREDRFLMIKEFIDRYAYWRFFANSEQLLATDLRAQIALIPISTHQYLRFLKGNGLALTSEPSSQKTKKQKPSSFLDF